MKKKKVSVIRMVKDKKKTDITGERRWLRASEF